MNVVETVTENIKLAEKVAHRYTGRAEFDDLRQVCCLALMKAAENFKEDRGAKFSTYAYRVMSNEVVNYLNSQRSYFENELIGEEVASGCEYELIDTKVENTLLIEQVKRVLTAEEFAVLYMTSVEGLSQSQVAKAIGSRQPQVCRIMKRAKEKAQAALGGYIQ